MPIKCYYVAVELRNKFNFKKTITSGLRIYGVFINVGTITINNNNTFQDGGLEEINTVDSNYNSSYYNE